MIEKETSRDDEPVIRVSDRRKFNLDGSVREGVTLEPEKPKKEEPRAEDAETVEEASHILEDAHAEAADQESELLGGAESDIPGADDPASFVNFLSTLATNAAASLGAMPHPVTGQRSVDLDTGKYWLDVLAMLREKTKGNLHAQESRLFEGLLADLRMQYVQLVRATEEKLKAQAAQKFSAKDILGKR